MSSFYFLGVLASRDSFLISGKCFRGFLYHLVSALTNNIHDHLIIQNIRISLCGSCIEDLILIQIFLKRECFISWHLWKGICQSWLVIKKKLALYSILVQQKKKGRYKKAFSFFPFNFTFQRKAFAWDWDFFLPTWHLLLPIWNFTFIQFSEEELFLFIFYVT